MAIKQHLWKNVVHLQYICRAHVSLGVTQSETEHSMGGCFKLL